jgi:hypothetical protein
VTTARAAGYPHAHEFSNLAIFEQQAGQVSGRKARYSRRYTLSARSRSHTITRSSTIRRGGKR